MSGFSLDWFKKQKQEQELKELQLEEQRLRNELLRKQLEEKEEEENEDNEDWMNYYNGYDEWLEKEEEEEEEHEEEFTYVKPYTQIKLVNDVLTIVLNDGNIISKPGATQEDYNNAKNAYNEAALFNIVMSQEVIDEKAKRDAEIEKMRALFEGLEKLRKYSSEFVIEGGSVYFAGIERSLPQLLVEEVIVVVDGCEKRGVDFRSEESYLALKRFFMWCCLNPRAEVAHELYRFLKENSFRITKQGFFVALRNVVSLCDDTELVDFVTNSYNKIKAIWKKDPDEYRVVKSQEDQYSLEKVTDVPNGEIVGNLTTLYLEVPEMKNNRYTDDWTKTFDIRVGRPVNMPISECNWSTQDCAAAGLHFTADQIHYVGCGDTSMLILINPMKVVGIGQHKGRCYEYLPLMTVPREEATQILHDVSFDTLQLDDDYAIRELEGLAERTKAGFIAESRKYDVNLSKISEAEIRNITMSLDEMIGEIANRVKNI